MNMKVKLLQWFNTFANNRVSAFFHPSSFILYLLKEPRSRHRPFAFDGGG